MLITVSLRPICLLTYLASFVQTKFHEASGKHWIDYRIQLTGMSHCAACKRSKTYKSVVIRPVIFSSTVSVGNISNGKFASLLGKGRTHFPSSFNPKVGQICTEFCQDRVFVPASVGSSSQPKVIEG